MASNREQAHVNYNPVKNLSISKSEPTQTKQSEVKQISFDRALKHKESIPSSLFSPMMDYHAQRTSSAPVVDRQVGSNK